MPLEILNSSTSVIQITTLPAPIYELSNVSYNGQTFTIYDTTGSASLVTTTPIQISTTGTGSINSISTSINQPYGFITFQGSSVYSVLNSFPFRDQQVSAGLLTLTASTLQTQVLSSITGQISSISVENLTVSQNLIQNTNLIVTTQTSSIGNVFLLSSFFANSALFSSALTVYGSSIFLSSLQVSGSVIISSSLLVTDSLYNTSSLYVGGFLSSGQIVNISKELKILNSFDIRQSTSITDIAASAIFNSSISGVSSINIGTHLTTSTLNILGNGLSTLANTSIDGSLIVKNIVSTSGTLTLGGSLQTQSLSSMTNFNVLSNIFIFSSASVYGSVSVLGSTNTYNLINTENVQIQLNAYNINTVTNSISSYTTLGVNTIYNSNSTIIGNSFSTHSHLATSTLNLNGLNFKILSNAEGSTILGNSIEILKQFSVGQNLIIGGTSKFYSSLFVKSDIISRGLYSTIIQSSFIVSNNLNVLGTTSIVTYPLTSSFTANSLTVSSLTIGTILNTSSLLVSTLYVSSLIISGSNQNQNRHFITDGLILGRNISSFNVSTSQFNITNTSAFQFNTMTVAGTNPLISNTQSLDVNTPSYLYNTIYTDKIVSTYTVSAYKFSGKFSGDGLNLTNLPLPKNININSLIVSTFSSFNVITQTQFASTLLTYSQFNPLSTTYIRDLSIFGNASLPLSFSNNNIVALPNSQLILNSTLFVSPTFTGILESTINTNYDIVVNGIMKIKGVIGPNIVIPVANLYSDTIFTSTVYVNQLTTVSSGNVIFPNAVFIPNVSQINMRSTNTIQTSLSTILFNSTLSVDRGNVGIRTLYPNYNLDVNNRINVVSTTFASSIIIQSQLNLQTSLISPSAVQWVGTSASNLKYSYDGSVWNQGTNTRQMNNIAYNGFIWITVSNTFDIVANSILLSTDGINWVNSSTTNISFSGKSIAWNGVRWIAVGSSILTSRDGYNWTLLVSSIQLNDITWNGYIWTAVGNNVIYTSIDGLTWGLSNSSSMIANAITWDGRVFLMGGVILGIQNATLVKTVPLKGITSWVSSYTTTTPLSTINDIGFNGTMYALAGTTYTDISRLTSPLQYSYDGTVWFPSSGDLFSTVANNILWNGSYWLAAGDIGVKQSYDGITWTTYNSPTSIVLASGIDSTANGRTIKYSLDNALTWTNTNSAFYYICNNIAFDGAFTWVAAGANGDFNSLKYSSNATSWINARGGFLGSGRGSAYGNVGGSNGWIAVGDDQGSSSTIKYSLDGGQSWSNVLNGFRYGGNSVAWNGSNRWMAVGYNGDCSSIKTSVDGITWTNTLGSFQTYGYSVNHSNGTWIAGGDDTGSSHSTIKISSDGLNWTNSIGAFTYFAAGISPGLINGTTNGWVAVGDKSGGTNIKYSINNGLIWSNITTGGIFTGDNGGLSVSYSPLNNTWVACGDNRTGIVGLSNQNTIQYSGDGLNWSNATDGFYNITYSVQFGVGRFPVPATPYIGIGFASNQTSIISINNNGGQFMNLLQTPAQGIIFQQSTNQISLFNSTVSFNQTLFINTDNCNISIPNKTIFDTLTRNTLFVNEYVNVSGFVSTGLLSPNALYINIQSV